MNTKLILIGLLLVLYSTQTFAITGTNLVSWYKFDETVGTNVIDYKDYDLNGTNTGATINQAGIIGKSYLFDGTTNKIVNPISSLNNPETLSYALWVKPTASPSNLDTFNIGGTIPATQNSGWRTSYYNNNGTYELWFVKNSPEVDRQCALSEALSTTNWSHIVYTLGADGIKVYLNGTNICTYATDTSYTTATNPLYIGADPRQGGTVNNGWYGLIDETSLWNKQLSQIEINELYNSGAGITYPFPNSASFSYSINKNEAKIYLTDTSTFPIITDWNWLKDGVSFSTDQNTDFSVISNTDYNVCLIINSGSYSHCSTINPGELFGRGFLKMYDSANNELDGVSYSITPTLNGLSSGVLADNNLDLNLQAITSQNYTFTFTKPNYTTLSFTLPLTQYTDFNYNFVLIDSNKSTNVNFQVFNASGAYANTKTFFAYDYSLNKYVGIQTTDTIGRLAFNLDQTKSDYNFFSTDFNFGTTVWTINKPKDVLTLLDINDTWDYSITGASYSSASNVASGIQKLLLQNTVYPYIIKINDTNNNYVQTTFGLKSVTSELTKTLTPYLYKYDNSELKLIKLLDFMTNQPHSASEELVLSLYTDFNGLIPIGTFVNDSTGTYNIYMDANSTYELQVLSQSYTLRPTLDIYYLYLTQDVSILIDNNLLVDANAPVMDSNLPIIFMQIREVVFGCTMDEDNCYPSMIFSLIAIALLLIVLAISGQVGAISQSVSTGILLTIFLIIGFIPLWLYGVGVVILIAWGVFGQ